MTPICLAVEASMFLLTLIVATTNLALGYAVAVSLGWANMPDFGKKTPPSESAAPPHGH
jgi:hypothetical protein